jgi:glycosyltransferase involved in cell wall biosynthesis
MKIGQIFNDFTEPGGEQLAARNIAQKIGAVCFERNSKEWVDSQGIRRLKHVLDSFHHGEVLEEFEAWIKSLNPDVLLFHNILPVISPSVIFKAREMGIPSVVYLHSYRYLCTNGFFLNHGKICERCIHGNFLPAATTACWRDSHALSAWYGSILTSMRFRGFFDAVDHFIAVSEFVKNKYVEAGVPSSKITVLHNFFDTTAAATFRHENYVLYMGRLSSEKGIGTLLKAASCLPDVSFRIAGEGPCKKEAETFIAKSGLKNIELLGHVSGDRKQSLLSGASMLIVPSEWYEPCPMTVLESYAYGKPVIASRIGGLPEIIFENETGKFFEPGDAKDLAENIRSLFLNPPEIIRLGQNARHWLEQNGSSDVWFKKWNSLIQNLPHR